jgi:oligopeptidase B
MFGAICRLARCKLDEANSLLFLGVQAPVAIQRPHKLTEHGDTRYDPFYWLRSDARDDKDVLAYLKKENEYCKAVMADTEGFQERLFEEMKGRIQETDCSVPIRRSGYYYYTRTFEGKQYRVHCRRSYESVRKADLPDNWSPLNDRYTVLIIY